jgi:hypothetical protein
MWPKNRRNTKTKIPEEQTQINGSYKNIFSTYLEDAREQYLNIYGFFSGKGVTSEEIFWQAEIKWVWNDLSQTGKSILYVTADF